MPDTDGNVGGDGTIEETPPRRDWRLVIATAVAALVPSIIGLVRAQTLKVEKQEARVELQEGRDNYGEYVIDQMKRDEALERALLHCLASLHGFPGPVPTLDDIAERYGYEP
jgi:hypothetical protein